MTAKLFSLPKQTPFTNAGALIPGAKAYFYVQGTTTPQDTYQESDLTTPHTNPVIADGNGRFPAIYLDQSKAYKVQLTDAADVEIYTEDDFLGELTATEIEGALSTTPTRLDIYPTIAAETSESVTPSDNSYPVGDIRRYGAIMDDSGASAQAANSLAFNDAVKVCRNRGYTVVITGGNACHFDSQLSVTAGATTACRVNFWQDKNCTLYSYVTGSVANYDTAGFAILFDGWKESSWYNLSLNYTNGTAGIALRCRNQSTVFNDFYSPTIRGGTVVGDRTTRTNISCRFIGNETSASSTGYVCYWNTFHGGYFDIGYKHIDCLVGDGSAATQQPNAQKVLGTQFERYLIAFATNDTDEHFLNGVWTSNATTISIGTAVQLTQTGGTANCELTSHGLLTDDIVQISGATPTDYNGMARVTYVDDDNFTYTKTNGVAIPGGTTSPATGTITVTQYSVVVQGDTTFSQFGINNESLGIGYFIEDGGQGGNIIQIIDNVSSGNSVVEDLTEDNLILDRQFYSASGTWRARIGTTNLFESTETETTFNLPVKGSSFRADQTAVASATNITYTDTADVWRITGTTTINTITDPGDGSPIIYLIFNAGLTVNDDGTSSGNIKLDGGTDFVATADDTLTLVWDKTNDQWLELSRAVN